MNWNKIIYWLPRIIVILFICFISLFALDVFGEFSGFEILVALFMHLVPSFILIILLIISWKYELVGGILFLVLGVVFTFWFDLYENLVSFLLIGLPVYVVGILFLFSFKLNKKKKK